MDDVFPPNVVVFSPQKASDHEDNNSVRSTVGERQHRICSSSSSFSASGHSSPPRSVEPDSTVHPGHTEATRDIMRALSDKIRRNKSKRLNTDSVVVSTTSSPDRPPQSPVNKSGHSLSPGPVEAANPLKSEDNGAVQHSIATGPINHHQLHSNKRSPTTSSRDKTTTTSSRKTGNGSQLQLTSHSPEGICENRSKGNDEPNESKGRVSNILDVSLLNAIITINS